MTVDGELVGAIGPGWCALVGAGTGDSAAAADRLAERIWHLRAFADDRGNMNLSAADLGRQVLVVPQFTLYADTSRGRRPSFTGAAAGEPARVLVERVAQGLAELGARVATGRFGAHMMVALVNDGPVTLLLET